ncbi:MAG: AlpA family phage regulatory protein [Planctomycetota bacterium]
MATATAVATVTTERELLTFKDTARRLTVSERTLWRILQTKKDFPRPVRISDRRIAFRPADVDAYCERRIGR